jgi:hypothetical protein
MKLWNIWECEDADFSRLVKSVGTDFYGMKLTKQGEIKHVAGMLIWFSKNKLISTSLKTTIKAVHKAIDGMAKQNLIQVLSKQEEGEYRRDDAYAGLGFIDAGSEEFKAVVQKIQKYQARRRAEAVKTSARPLLEPMTSDPDAFQKAIVAVGSGEYSDSPVFKFVSAKDFVRTLISLPAGSRLKMGSSLRERYNFVHSAPRLLEELGWLGRLSSEINRQIKHLSQPTRYHLEQFSSRDVASSIEALLEYKRSRSQKT